MIIKLLITIVTICSSIHADNIVLKVTPQACRDRLFTHKELNSVQITQTPKELFNQFNIGFGGAYAFKFLSQSKGEAIWVSSVDLVMDKNLTHNIYYQRIKKLQSK